MRTITRLYDNYSDAVAVVTALEAADLRPNREISLIANENARGRDTTVENSEHRTAIRGRPWRGARCDSGRGHRHFDRPRPDGHSGRRSASRGRMARHDLGGSRRRCGGWWDYRQFG